MLNALADTNAAQGAVTLATDTLRAVLSDNPEAPPARTFRPFDSAITWVAKVADE